MVEHIQTIRRQFPDDLFDCFDHFVGLPLKGLTFSNLVKIIMIIMIVAIRNTLQKS